MCGGLCPRTPGLKPRVEMMPLRGVQFPGSGLTCEEIFALSGATGVCRGCGVTIGHPGRTQSWSGERGECERLQVPTTGGSLKEPGLTHQLWAALKGFHHKGPSPFFVLTAFQPCSIASELGWNPELASCGLSGTQPPSAGHRERRAPLAASCPQPCRTSRG